MQQPSTLRAGRVASSAPRAGPAATSAPSPADARPRRPAQCCIQLSTAGGCRTQHRRSAPGAGDPARATHSAPARRRHVWSRREHQGAATAPRVTLGRMTTMQVRADPSNVTKRRHWAAQRHPNRPIDELVGRGSAAYHRCCGHARSRPHHRFPPRRCPDHRFSHRGGQARLDHPVRVRHRSRPLAGALQRSRAPRKAGRGGSGAAGDGWPEDVLGFLDAETAEILESGGWELE